jgi:lysophospholipase L1-like esterase
LLALGIGACVPGAGVPLPESAAGGSDAATAPSPSGGQSGTPNNVVPSNSPNTGAATPLGAGSLRIVTVGDSLTEGNGDDSGVGYPGRLLERVEPLRPGSTLLNLGRSGWTSEQLINGAYGNPSQLDAAMAAQPTVACVWIGSNDLWYLYSGGGVSADQESADLSVYATNIDTIISKLTTAGARVYVAMLDDQSKRPVSVKGVLFPDMTAVELAQMSAQVVRYNNAIIAIAQKYGATVVDFYHTTIFVTPATLADDDIHPNSAGYDQIASLWFASIEPALR